MVSQLIIELSMFYCVIIGVTGVVYASMTGICHNLLLAS